MSEAVWYRSLYWRIAIGFVALLAALLVIQALVFVWLTVVVGRSTLGPAQLATEVAADVSTALAQTPELDVNEFVSRRFGHLYQAFLVVMHDGRSASNRPEGLPPGFANFARVTHASRSRRAASGAADRPRPEGAGRGAWRGGRRPVETASIVAPGTDTEIGFVAVPGSPPPASIVLRQLGPTLAIVAVALLIGGSAVMALLIFRPAHKRLRALERAATALGAGQADVRAIETGGDEVTSLARAFNRMAGDLSARAAALVESDRARRQLLADVSHELMTPLAAIRGYTETLAMPALSLDAGTRDKYLRIIEEETQKLEAIIGDLLDLARVEGGGVTLALEPVRVADLFGRVADRHGPTIRDRRIDVRLDVSPRDLVVKADPNRFEQALQNLAANALRHTPDGGRVELDARQRDDTVRIRVRDTGPGIPPEHLSRVFDRFYKVDAARTATAQPSGSGLGLSIVKAIIERHGGTVTAGNAPDGGAVFEVVLPAGV
jgi:signal transduction histidine kinase